MDIVGSNTNGSETLWSSTSDLLLMDFNPNKNTFYFGLVKVFTN